MVKTIVALYILVHTFTYKPSMCKCKHMHTQTHRLTKTDRQTDGHTHKHTHTQTRTNIHTNMHAQTDRQTDRHTHTSARTHAPTRTHMRTHAGTHTHNTHLHLRTGGYYSTDGTMLLNFSVSRFTASLVFVISSSFCSLTYLVSASLALVNISNSDCYKVWALIRIIKQLWSSDYMHCGYYRNRIDQ